MREQTSSPASGPDRIISGFEKVVVAALVVMMMLVVALAVIEVGWIIAKDVLSPPVVLLDLDELLEVFGSFLLVLIGVELLETIKAYLREHVVHVEIVLEVALIAVARKIIVLDAEKYSGTTIFAISSLVLALAAAYHLQRRARARSLAARGAPAPSPPVNAARDSR